MQTVLGVSVATTKAEQIAAVGKIIEACVNRIRGNEVLSLHQQLVLGMALRRMTAGERKNLRGDIVGRPHSGSGSYTDYQLMAFNRCNTEFDRAWASSGRLKRGAADFKAGKFIPPDTAHKVVYDWVKIRLREI